MMTNSQTEWSYIRPPDTSEKKLQVSKIQQKKFLDTIFLLFLEDETFSSIATETTPYLEGPSLKCPMVPAFCTRKDMSTI